MTEQEFLNAYLMGRHDVFRNMGLRLWDTEFYDVEPDPMEIEIAQTQFKRYRRNPKINNHIIK